MTSPTADRGRQSSEWESPETLTNQAYRELEEEITRSVSHRVPLFRRPYLARDLGSAEIAIAQMRFTSAVSGLK
jgi:hypothetical protein